MNAPRISNCTTILLNDSNGLQQYRNVCTSDMEGVMNRRHGIGAGCYVIIVIVFYGTSIMFLIASHIKRKHEKIQEDRQINSYLKEFQVVRETSSRDNYRTLKRNMIAYLIRTGIYGSQNNPTYSTLYRCLSKTLIPMTAIALSPASSLTSLLSRRNSLESNGMTPSSRNVLQSIQECEEQLNTTESPRDEKEFRQTFVDKNDESLKIDQINLEKRVNFSEVSNAKPKQIREQPIEKKVVAQPEKPLPENVGKIPSPVVQFSFKQPATTNRLLIPLGNTLESVRPQTAIKLPPRPSSSEFSRIRPHPNFISQHSNPTYPANRTEYYSLGPNRQIGSTNPYNTAPQQKRRFGNQSLPNTGIGFSGGAHRKSTNVEQQLEHVSTV